MVIISKSILRRVFIYFLLFSALLTAIVFTLFANGIRQISIPQFLVAILVFIVFFLLAFLYEVVLPFKKILVPMKELLTGKKYHKIFSSRIDEFGILAHFFNEVTKSLEEVKQDIKEGRRMLSELEIASKIQKGILPPQNPQVPGLDIVAKTRPAVELGGDNFDFITVGDNTFIYVGDVTGHGVPAAIIMTMVNTLIHTFAELSDSAYNAVVNVNKQLKTRIKSTMFMTLLMLKWNQKEQKMSYVGAGHEHVVVYRAGTGKCEVRATGGIALGMVPDNSKLIKEQDLPLEKDDVIILYSDGLTEGRNMQGEMYGLNRLLQSVELYASRYGSDGIVNYVAQDYSRFVQDHTQDDDVTLIAMKYVGIGNENKSSVLSTTAWNAAENQVADPSNKDDSPLV